ncbi:FISUMP domain-containing protein [uncultured Elizabethkingia sp.]|uniref:FISUMP domain-containing protein n=1 Tax=uncultured Elizabethkingia sp. TaxID=432638 RepID=UPI00259941A8|nr:FISUMP domain-containing protein [uncultured Elizabethkingia sp.]
MFKKSIHLFSIGMLLLGCRSTDQDNILSGSGVAPVKINLLGTEYANSNKPAQVASINNKGLNVDNNVQRYSVLLSPSSFITAELTPNRSLSPVASSKNLNTVAAVAGDQLGAGMKFRVIAYRKDNGNYQTYQDYTVGQQAAPLMLDGGIVYDIVVYSYGVNALPTISANEQININSATVNYDDENPDLMYQKVSYTPDGNKPNNILNVTLRHKVAQITAIVNSGSLGNITNISGGLIAPHYRNGIFSLSSGIMSGRTNMTSGEILSYWASEFPGTTVTAEPIFLNSDTNGNLAGGFSAEISIAGINKTISLPNSFKITPEYKSNLTINLMKCGAYIGPNNDPANYKEFMCQNLGATEGINPFSPEAGNHGAKYQWGASANESGRYYSQADDQSNSGNIIGWSSIPKPVGSWSDTNKTANDPCPPGYRVPTSIQWQAVINNNNVERVGSWADDNTNYSSVLYFRSPSNIRTLMLPAAGYRSYAVGKIINRGTFGYYWSSSSVAISNANILIFDSSDMRIFENNRTLGYSVRCIAE